MPVNIERRRKVMARSMKLGHCVCDPRKPCPCDTFNNLNICTCAGEKPQAKTKDIALTKYVRKAGCASKIGQADLLRILRKLPPVNDPRVLVGTAAGDDAGVYRIDDRYALVQTVDVFTPCVDDPYLFGQIAAANSLSDIYAMGGRPLTALSIIGFPIDELDDSIMEAILRGGMDKLAEAECSLIGGHSINDEEIKCGFAVTGLIDEKAIVEHDTVRPGDALVLTKPLGTGIVCFAAQIGLVDEECLAEVGASMATLNRDAAELMIASGAHACTDVTGYGLMGHLVEMVNKCGLTAEIDITSLPVFAVAAECLEKEIIPGAIERNQEYSMAWVIADDSDGAAPLPILYDPQTSGGLLIALPGDKAEAFVRTMNERGHTSTAVIGNITRKSESSLEGKVVISGAKLNNLIGARKGITMPKKYDPPASLQTKEPVDVPADAGDDCCSSPPYKTEAPASDSLELFKDFMKQVNAEGRIDKRAKKLMAIALSVARHCKPCLVIHIRGALSMGISRAEIDEAAGLAIAFAGCPAMMLYQEVCREIDG